MSATRHAACWIGPQLTSPADRASDETGHASRDILRSESSWRSDKADRVILGANIPKITGAPRYLPGPHKQVAAIFTVQNGTPGGTFSGMAGQWKSL